jgi:hypothetical protein
MVSKKINYSESTKDLFYEKIYPVVAKKFLFDSNYEKFKELVESKFILNEPQWEYIKEHWDEKESILTFKKGVEFLEVHYEVVKRITLELEVEGRPSLAFDVMENQGLGGLYELAENLTTEFVILHKDNQWDGDFFETIEKFLNEKLLP